MRWSPDCAARGGSPLAVGRHRIRIPCARRRNTANSSPARATLTVFTSDDIALEQYLGQQGILTISSYKPSGASGYGEDLGLEEVRQLGSQDMQQGEITVRLYTGRVARGALSGTRVVCKAYPKASLSNSDALAANELTTHAALQPPSVPDTSPYLVELLGGFQVTSGANAGEQWLVFKNDGVLTAADYASAAAGASQAGSAIGDGEFWDRFDTVRVFRRRHAYIVSALRQAMCGLAFMHARFRLHQSLGPYSLVLSTPDERDVRVLEARVRDLGFAVDVSDAALYGGATLADIWERGSIGRASEGPGKEQAEALWRRARSEGALDEVSMRNFGFADDIYSAGLLLAYMAFVPLAEPGSIDGPSLQRLLESTFRLDIQAVREYADADERWARACAFLELGGGKGWELLEAMLNPNWRLRPTAESCLAHPFLNGEVLD